MNQERENFSNGTDGVQERSGTFTDLHCHCLPGLDDGPSNPAEALALCRALVADSVATAVATPHQLGRYDGLYDAQEIRLAVAQFNRMLAEADIPLTVLPGADVRLDERIVGLLQSDAILTVADTGRYLMLELPHEVFIDPQILLLRLGREGIRTMISHPERQPFLAERPSYVQQWAPFESCLQITAGSFLGEFGRTVEEAAWAFLDQSFPVVVATDAHSTHARAPRMTAAHRLIAEYRGRDVADVLCIENPRRLMAGEELIPVGGPMRYRSIRRGEGR
jgi:protein-tyrosine phosphatase